MQVLSHGFYDFEAKGKEHLPTSGGFVITCNHVSYLDWMFIMAALAPRPVRFLIDESFTNARGMGDIINLSNAIPVSVDNVKPKAIVASLKKVSDALNAGQIVGMFPEGGLTRNGEVQELRAGLKIILRQAPVPVVPACLSGLWGSMWSWSDGKVVFKAPKKLRTKVVLNFGAPLAAVDATPERLHAEIKKLKV